MNEKKTIFLTIEVFQREFESVIILASALIESGYRVYLGHLEECLLLADHLAKKAIFKHKSGFLNLLQNRYRNQFEHIIVVEDLELSIALPEDQEQQIVDLRMRPQVKSYDYDIYLCSKYTHADVINQLITEYGRTGKVYTIGRIGFSEIENTKPNKKNPNEIKLKNYKYKIVIFSSFSAVTNEDWEREFQNLENPLDNQIMRERRSAMPLVIKFIKQLSALTGADTCIIFRPHNSESAEDWKNIFCEMPNFFVRKNDKLDSLIDAADIIAHVSSNIAIQAALRGKRTFNICPVGFMKKSISARLSVQINDPLILIDALKNSRNNEKDIISEAITKLEESGVCINSNEKIADSIIKIFDAQKINAQRPVFLPVKNTMMCFIKYFSRGVFFKVINFFSLTKYVGGDLDRKIDRHQKKGLDHLSKNQIFSELSRRSVSIEEGSIVVKKVLPYTYLLEKR